MQKPSKLHLKSIFVARQSASKSVQNPSQIHLEVVPEPPQNEVPRKQRTASELAGQAVKTAKAKREKAKKEKCKGKSNSKDLGQCYNCRSKNH